MNNQAKIGDFWSWLGTAAGNVNNVVQDAAPALNTLKNTFGGSPAPNYNPSGYATYPTPPVYYNTLPTAANNNNNNTLLYIGLAAAAVVAIILLNKK